MRTIYHNGIVYSGELPLRQAFIVEDDRFVFVGNDTEVFHQAADNTVDLGGKFVCAGLNDSHMHLLNYGQYLRNAPLNRHTNSMEDMLECLKKQAQATGYSWIMGRGWNQDFFTDVRRMPDRWDLDRVSTERPVCAVRACGHALVVNSKALEVLGINGQTPQIEGGQIVLENGEPNGIFLDNAMDLVYAGISAPDKDAVKDMIRSACAALNAYGVTSCQSDDYCVFQGLPCETVNEAYRELEASGELTVRVYEQANFTSVQALQAFLDAGNGTGKGSGFFKIGPLKLLGDGALGARTAYLSQPYADDPSTRGLSIFSQQEFDDLIGLAHENGMQVAVHAIGDACLDMVLDAMEKALTKLPRTDHRHGIVHCQITRPDQLDRIARLNLHIYAQSIFLDYDIRIVKQRAGESLAASSYSWKRLMDLGATVSNGTDCPVELPNALGGIQCAVTRCTLDGEGPYLPDQAFTVQEALDSYTSAGAYASFEERVKGKIQPEFLADFVVLGENPFEVEPERIHKIPIVATYLGGKRVFGNDGIR